MELYDVMRTTFSGARLHRRSAARRHPATGSSTTRASRRAAATARAGGHRRARPRDARGPRRAHRAGRQALRRAGAAGENPWNTIDPPRVDAATIERTPAAGPAHRARDQGGRGARDLRRPEGGRLDRPGSKRVGVISGASIYPFAWNILLAARHEGFAGTITTLAVRAGAEDPGAARHPVARGGRRRHAARAPGEALTKLKRKPVAEFAMLRALGRRAAGAEDVVTRLARKVALITGGASGIGEATVRLFVRGGRRVVIADIQDERGRAAAAELGERRRLRSAPTSAARTTCRRRRARRQARSAGSTASSTTPASAARAGRSRRSPSTSSTTTMGVLLRGVFLGMKHAAPVMKRQGGGIDHQHRQRRGAARRATGRTSTARPRRPSSSSRSSVAWSSASTTCA